MIQKNFGWVPDRPDQRDYLYSAIKPRVRLPKRVDLRSGCSPVEYQGELGSRTAQALAGNLEYLDRMLDGVHTDVSRLFIYYNERVLMDSIEYDSGATLRDGIKTLKNDGTCPETLWPYRPGRFDRRPPARCYAEAKKHRIVSYHRIATIGEMLACLAEGYPFVFGFTVYESLDSDRVKKTGVVPMPKRDEIAIGGHAVMAVGYDQAAKRFIVRNSWGVAWGMKGYCVMPFKYLETLAGDLWTIRR